jgi:hypothetical protein
MKHATTVLADAPTTSLKLAYSYLVHPSEAVPQAAPKRIPLLQKVSTFKSLFVVHPVVNNPAVWDAGWYNNYE